MLLKKLCIILTVLSLMLITGCHSYKSDIEKAELLCKKGDYAAAQQLYQYVIDNCDDKKLHRKAVSNLDDMFEECFELAKKQFDSGLYDAAKKKYQYILNNARNSTLLAKVQEKLNTFDSDIAELTERQRVTEYYRRKSIDRGLKMPHFITVDSTVGKNMIIMAILLDDQSKDNIIHTAFCFKNQSGNSNVFVYFVKDRYYSLKWKDKLTHKVKGAYVHVNGRSILYLFNPDGTEETIDI